MSGQMQRALAGIVLAAGRGTRFGGDKLSQALPDGTPIGLASARAMRALPGRVLIVIAKGDRTVRARFESEGFDCVECGDADRGMGASLARGVSVTREAAGWLIALGDMPFVQRRTVTIVADAIATGARIAAPVHGGRRGHPVGFAAVLRDELLALDGDEGARAVIVRHSQHLVLIDCNDAGTIADIDTPADLAAVLTAKRAD